MIKATFNRTTRRLTLTARTVADKQHLAGMALEMSERGVHYTTENPGILHLPLIQTAHLEAVRQFVEEAS